MSTIDEKVVAAKFNNASFEANAKQTLGTLSNLAKGFKLDGASKGLEGVSAAAKNVNLGSLAGAIDTLSSKFNALSVIGISALASITNKAVNAGIQMAKSLTIAPIGQGFAEYEQGLTAFQTIVANTKSSGTTVKQVNDALKELNVYANKTIYSFGDMNQAIGLFTAQGVSLKDSLTGIKGIFNIVSLTGGDAQKANGAIYQLSQAIASGTVKAQDWISVVNAGIGGTDFQNQLKQTARTHGIAVDKMIKKEGGFKNSLQDGWLTSKVLLETLSQYTGDMSAQQLKSMGYSAQQIKQIQALGATAAHSATNIKSYSQLMDTLKSNIVTSWATSFKTIIGNLDQASQLWTSVGDSIGGVIQNSADARNKLLSDWSALGGRKMLIDGLANAFNALASIIKPIKDAFREVFPPTTAKQLVGMTKTFRDFTKHLILGKTNMDLLKRTFKGIFSVFNIVWQVAKGVVSVFTSLFGVVQGGSGGFLTLTAMVGDFLTAISAWLSTGNKIQSYFDGIAAARNMILQPLVEIIGILAKAISALAHGDISLFKKEIHDLVMMGPKIFAGMQKSVTDSLGMFRNITAAASDWLHVVQGNVTGKFQQAVGVISDGIAFISYNISQAKDLLTGFTINIGSKGMEGASAGLSGMTAVAERAQHVWDGLKHAFDDVSHAAAPILASISTLFQTIANKLSEYIKGLNMNDAVALLNTGFFILMYKAIKNFMDKLSGLVDSFKHIADSISKVFGELTNTLKTMQKDIKANIILKIAISVGILVGALYVLSKLNATGIAQGLAAIGVLMFMLNRTMQSISSMNVANDAKILSAAAGMVAVAIAIRILASAVKTLSDLSWADMLKGLVGVGVLLAGLTLFTKFADMDHTSLRASVGLLALAAAVALLAIPVKVIGSMSVGDITKATTAIVVMMASMSVMVSVMNNTKGVFQAAAGMLVLSFAMTAMAGVLKLYSMMDWGTMLKGLAAVTLSVLSIGLAMKAMPASGSGTLLVASAALVILAGALQIIGSMPLGDIAKAIVALAASLAIIVIAIVALEGAMPGALALLVISGSLLVFAGVMQLLGGLAWEDIAKGLVAIAGFFVLLGVAGLVLGPVIPVLIGLGVALQMLGQAMALAGLGFLAFAVGFATLAAIGTAGFAVLTVGFMGLLNLIPLFAQQIGLGIRAFAVVIAGSLPQLTAAITIVILAVLNAIQILIPRMTAVGLQLAFALLNSVAILLPKLYDTGLRVITGFLQAIAARIGGIVKAGADIIVNFLRGLQQQVPRIADQAAATVVAFVQGTADAINKHSGDMDTAGRNLAGSIIEGMVRGIWAGVQGVVDAAGGIATSALNAAARVLHINSPSKAFQKLGKFSVEGFAIGLRGNKPAIDAAMSTMRTLLSDTVASSQKDIDSATARLKKLTSARHKDLAAIKQTQRDLAAARLEHKKAINATNLSKTWGDEQRKLDSLATAYDVLGSKLKDAQQKLADATKARDDFAQSTKDSFDNLPDITKDTKISEYVSSLEKQIVDTQIFASQLQELRKRGLNDAVYKELLAKGTDAIPFATQLLDGGQNAITQVNTLSGALDKAAGNLGKTASTALYQAAVDSAAGLVKGLQNQQAAIAKQMNAIASIMVASIKKQLGIRSPSREFAKIGDWSIQGLVSGLQASSSLSEQAAAEVGHATIDSLRKTLTGLKDVVNAEMNVDPTIRPVLDLSQVQKDSVKMGAMLGGPDIQVGTALEKAKHLSNQYNANQASRAQLDAVLAKPSVTFTQNNYSPKALSASTIYRNTNNQISKVKEGLTT